MFEYKTALINVKKVIDQLWYHFKKQGTYNAMFEYKTAQGSNIIIEYLFSLTFNIFRVSCFSLH